MISYNDFCQQLADKLWKFRVANIKKDWSNIDDMFSIGITLTELEVIVNQLRKGE